MTTHTKVHTKSSIFQHSTLGVASLHFYFKSDASEVIQLMTESAKTFQTFSPLNARNIEAEEETYVCNIKHSPACPASVVDFGPWLPSSQTPLSMKTPETTKYCSHFAANSGQQG